jgi:hypothetical protein
MKEKKRLEKKKNRESTRDRRWKSFVVGGGAVAMFQPSFLSFEICKFKVSW